MPILSKPKNQFCQLPLCQLASIYNNVQYILVEHTCQNFIFSGYFFTKCVLQLQTVYFCLKPVLNCKQNQILRLRPRRGRIFKKNPKITCMGGGKGPNHNYVIFSKWGFQCQDLGSPIKILDLREKSRSLRCKDWGLRLEILSQKSI